MIVEQLKSAYEHRFIVKLILKNQAEPWYGWVTGGHLLQSPPLCSINQAREYKYSFTFSRILDFETYRAGDRKDAPQVKTELFNSHAVNKVEVIDLLQLL